MRAIRALYFDNIITKKRPIVKHFTAHFIFGIEFFKRKNRFIEGKSVGEKTFLLFLNFFENIRKKQLTKVFVFSIIIKLFDEKCDQRLVKQLYRGVEQLGSSPGS